MKKIIFAILSIAVLAIMGAAQGTEPVRSTQAAPRPTPPPLVLKVGDEAPDFTLPGTDGKKVHLGDFRGKSNVVLAFYVLAFTGG
jgi:cytochrome oxidase Cu insertion factor (SCO1/SenC/PrrC family)